jgi:hypothetical protein
LQYTPVHGRITNDAFASINLGFSGLKLWLNQCNYPGTWGEQWRDGWQDET